MARTSARRHLAAAIMLAGMVAAAAPLAGAEPDAINAPVATDAAIGSADSISPDTPVNSNEPVAADLPVAADAPVSTDLPVATEAPVAAGQPAPGERPVAGDAADTDTAPAAPWGALALLGAEVQPGTRRNLRWLAGQSFSGGPLRAPVVVVRGAQPGPTLCLTGAVHGDELNGVEIIRRVLAAAEPERLRGTLIGVPIVNLLGFAEGSRYLPDRTDLNRFFPGRPRGNAASRIAHRFFNDVVVHCERLVDLHTGSFKRSNLPQLRANLDHAAVREFVTHFGATAVLHRSRERGTLRDAATAAGIPAVTLELGEPATVQNEHVRYGVRAIHTLLYKLGMRDAGHVWQERQPIFFRARWLRAQRGGILDSSIALGAEVEEGQLLGKIINPLTNEEAEIRAPFAGRVLGRALNQFVLPGFATFHIGIETAGLAERDKGAPLPESTPGDDEEPAPAGTPEATVDTLIGKEPAVEAHVPAP